MIAADESSARTVAPESGGSFVRVHATLIGLSKVEKDAMAALFTRNQRADLPAVLRQEESTPRSIVLNSLNSLKESLTGLGLDAVKNDCPLWFDLVDSLSDYQFVREGIERKMTEKVSDQVKPDMPEIDPIYFYSYVRKACIINATLQSETYDPNIGNVDTKIKDCGFRVHLKDHLPTVISIANEFGLVSNGISIQYRDGKPPVLFVKLGENFIEKTIQASNTYKKFLM